MANPNEKKVDDDDFMKNLDTEYPLSGGEEDEDMETDEDMEDDEEDDEEFKESLDTEFPLSGGETD